MNLQPLLTIEHLAKLTGDSSHWTIRRHVAKGNIRVIRLGRRVFITPEEFERIKREGLPRLTKEPGQRGDRPVVSLSTTQPSLSPSLPESSATRLPGWRSTKSGGSTRSACPPSEDG